MKTLHKPELLAPAGSMEAFFAALDSGADAGSRPKFTGKPPYCLSRNGSYRGCPLRGILLYMLFNQGKCWSALHPINLVLTFYGVITYTRVIKSLRLIILGIKYQRFTALFVSDVVLIRSDEIRTVGAGLDMLDIIVAQFVQDNIGRILDVMDKE